MSSESDQYGFDFWSSVEGQVALAEDNTARSGGTHSGGCPYPDRGPRLWPLMSFLALMWCTFILVMLFS